MKQPAITPPVGIAFLLSQVGAHAANSFEQRLSHLGLRVHHAGLLRMLGSNPGMTQQALADLFGIFPSRLVALLDELEEEHFIERRNDPADRRSYRLFLTAPGRTILKKIGTVTHQLEDDLLASLTESQRGELARLLRGIVAQQQITPAVHPAYRDRVSEQASTKSKERK
jgi:DNA-binding MarR family transcriptional regulator